MVYTGLLQQRRMMYGSSATTDGKCEALGGQCALPSQQRIYGKNVLKNLKIDGDFPIALAAWTFPSSEEEWRRIAREFEGKWQFPNCLGSIDGYHYCLTIDHSVMQITEEGRDYPSDYLELTNEQYTSEGLEINWVYLFFLKALKLSDSEEKYGHLCILSSPLKLPPTIPFIDYDEWAQFPDSNSRLYELLHSEIAYEMAKCAFVFVSD
ncbi:unnamed protein product [Acanthoscelides obtectus]|uniref:Uncharacterized protein n=1 Tax=Acanthoscelides obtectus TaxID=200917 RepID=A0A9P0K5R8_ACAOB|nr:unnamed protein product [Acanthoscelides obtectus]CAK1651724.1 hypothetical protein AOBTE_LOCUS17412 [Acanthoscelides obtectus]